MYDERNRLMTETNELEKTRSFEYDKNGNRTQVTDRNGRITDYIYDNLNRQTHERWLDENGQVVNEIVTTYDAANQVTAVSDAHSAYTYTYDALGYQDRVDNTGFGGIPQVVLDYDYDAEGKLESVTEIIEGVEGATTSYDYDERDQVKSITQSGNGTSDKRVEFDYSPTGQFEDIRRYSDVEGTQLVASTDYDYDEHNRLDRLAHSNSEGSETAFYNFGYDAANRITQIVDVDGTTDYDYDQTNQLISADHSDADNPNESYDYDKNGNRTQSSQHGDDYVTGANNQLESDGVYTYTYDDQGNMIRQEEIASGNIRTFEWDYRNRLVAVTDETARVETQRVEYVYDVMGRRIAKTVDADGAGSDEAITTHFVYDRDNVSLEFVGQNATPTQRYLYGPQVDQVLAQEDNAGQVLWLLSDHLGTVKDLVDDTGNVLNHRTYDSYGNLIAQSNAEFSSRYGFTGRELDEETGLYYYRARYYHSGIGLFISQDPIGFDGRDMNLYRYVKNNPLSWTDPSGKVLIEVRMNTSNSRGNHAYILVHETDNHGDKTGTPMIFRGGPSEPARDLTGQIRTILQGGGTLQASGFEYGSIPVDYIEGSPDLSRVIYYNPCELARPYNDAMQDSVARIQQARFPYRILGPNSNSVVRQVLRDTGFDFTVDGNFESPDILAGDPDHPGIVPGWDNILFNTPVASRPEPEYRQNCQCPSGVVPPF